jgi:hypothetical protein
MSPPRCTGKRKDGKPCTAFPKKGTDRCGRHPRDDAPDTPSPAREETPRPERWNRDHWLDTFRWCGMVSMTCELMGISRQTAYAERQRNEDFAVAWADIEEETTEAMEREAYRRAVEGVTTPMVSAGKHVTDVQNYSDRLLEFMLKSRRPEKYRDRVDVNHSGKVEKKVKLDLGKLSEEELENLGQILDKLDEPTTA